jgi:uncharacterized ion transporter superfamily protein YfcC
MRGRLPDALVLLTACVLLAAAATWVLPAGQFERREDPEAQRSVVVAGTYTRVEQSPVGPFDAFVALPAGMAEAADVIFLVFLIGGAFTVVDETGALRRAMGSLVRALRGRDLLVIPIVSLFFATGGAAQNMQEEIVPLVPVLLLLARRTGLTPLVAVAMSAGAAFVGSAFSPINPFQVLIAQRVAGLPPGSGAGLRTVLLVLATGLWIGLTMRHAQRTRVPAAATAERAEAGPTAASVESDALTGRDRVVLGIVAAAFLAVVWGLALRGWDFDHLSATFFLAGVAAGLVSGMGLDGTARAYARGFRDMAYAGLLIGFARAIFVVLDQGRVIDTIVYGVFVPLEGLPRLVSALGMVLAQALVHVPVPSVSSQAVLTMPLLVPLSDLLELSRQVTVLAYQVGAGLCDMLTPTNGALMAILAAAGVRYDEWLRFVGPLYLALVALGGVAIWVAIAVGLS